MKKLFTLIFALFTLATFAQQGVPGNFRVGRDLYVGDDLTVRGSYDIGQGWALYADSSSVYGSRQVIAEGDTATVNNNALGVNVTTQIPVGVDSLYSSLVTDTLGVGTGVIEGITNGDVYQVRVDFTASSDATNGAGKGILYLDVNGTAIAHIPVLFVASDTTTNLQYSFSLPANVDASWVSNGAAVRFYSIAGNTKLYAQRFRIFRIHRAQ